MLDKRVEMFIQVAESGSLSKAARSQYLSAVSVKKQMDSLEAHVGTKLLKRTSRGIQLTPAGQELYEGAKKLQFLADRTMTKARGLGQGQTQTIRIGTSVLRPCRQLVQAWDAIEGEKPNLSLEIVPFDDDTASINEVVDTLGQRIDCFLAPCDSDHWRQTANILLLDEIPFCLGVPRRHPLASKKLLEWDDLDGETVMMVPASDSPVVADIREEIKENHPLITLATSPTHFDLSVFNKCEQSGYLLQTYDIWADAHPSLVTVPVNWSQRMPYGLVYAKRPSEAMEAFARTLSEQVVS